jgi:hypothetical protein
MSLRPSSDTRRAADAAENFLRLLAAADAGAIEDLLGEGASIQQPLWGAARGAAEIQVMVSRAGGWLTDRRASVGHAATTEGAERVVAEQVLKLVIDGRSVDLPIAVVADGGAGAPMAIRTYHSSWPLSNTHVVRPALIAGDPSIVVPDVVGAYQRSLAAGDLEGILAAFEDDAYAREPSGGEYVYRGKARVRQLYTMLFMTGGIPLEYCTLTDDGVRCAIEYNCVRFGKTQIVPQAGVAVYERGNTGLLAATRIYDDVNPPGARS